MLQEGSYVIYDFTASGVTYTAGANGGSLVQSVAGWTFTNNTGSTWLFPAELGPCPAAVLSAWALTSGSDSLVSVRCIPCLMGTDISVCVVDATGLTSGTLSFSGGVWSLVTGHGSYTYSSDSACAPLAPGLMSGWTAAGGAPALLGILPTPNDGVPATTRVQIDMQITRIRYWDTPVASHCPDPAFATDGTGTTLITPPVPSFVTTAGGWSGVSCPQIPYNIESAPLNDPINTSGIYKYFQGFNAALNAPDGCSVRWFLCLGTTGWFSGGPSFGYYVITKPRYFTQSPFGAFTCDTVNGVACGSCFPLPGLVSGTGAGTFEMFSFVASVPP